MCLHPDDELGAIAYRIYNTLRENFGVDPSPHDGDLGEKQYLPIQIHTLRRRVDL